MIIIRQSKNSRNYMIANNLQLNHITEYFRQYFNHGSVIDLEMRLTDLGFESLDYIALGTYIFKTLNQWIDVTKINNETRIADLPFCLISIPQEKNAHHHVKLDKIRQHAYTYELNNKYTPISAYKIHYLALKPGINLSLLEHAIRETLDNHYLLNSKLVKGLDGYYFEPSSKQVTIYFKSSFFFPKRDLTKLITTVYSDRLASIYLNKKGKNFYLIIAYHHIIIDGWSKALIQEEIFRRYANQYIKPLKNKLQEKRALNNIYNASLNESVNLEALKKILNSTKNPQEYFELTYLFSNALEYSASNIILTEHQLNKYAKAHTIQKCPYSTLIVFLVYEMLRKISGSDKLALYISLSNRFLPIPEICDLITDISQGLPLLLNKERINSSELAQQITETLKIYFKNMSYAAINQILLDNDTFLNRYISPFHQPYFLMLTYVNDISKGLYGTKSILNNYIQWSNSKTLLYPYGKYIFFHIEHIKNNLVINIHSSASKGVHAKFLKYISSNFI